MDVALYRVVIRTVEGRRHPEVVQTGAGLMEDGELQHIWWLSGARPLPELPAIYLCSFSEEHGEAEEASACRGLWPPLP